MKWRTKNNGKDMWGMHCFFSCHTALGNAACVSGTHGKTTTTSMITTALELAGRDPSAVIGGKLPLINGYGKAGKGDDIVIESCEFAETFLKLTPYLSVVLNIDNDHLDYYGSMGELKFAFKRFSNT